MLGSSASFGPLLADISHWFVRRRGLAVSIVASGNYLAGAVWPPIVQHLIETVGWRTAHLYIGAICLLTMLPLTYAMRRAPPHVSGETSNASVASRAPRSLGISPFALQTLLMIAGVACCVAMSMPQVHIVAYCADLGYGPAVGAQMLSIMLAFGIVSRLASGWIADHIGGLRTLLLGSALQGVALLFYIPFDGLTVVIHRVRDVRIVSGRHRAELRDHRARVLRAERSRCTGRAGCNGHAVRHGARRLDVGRRVRPHRFVSRRVHQRAAVELRSICRSSFGCCAGLANDCLCTSLVRKCGLSPAVFTKGYDLLQWSSLLDRGGKCELRLVN